MTVIAKKNIMTGKTVHNKGKGRRSQLWEEQFRNLQMVYTSKKCGEKNKKLKKNLKVQKAEESMSNLHLGGRKMWNV